MRGKGNFYSILIAAFFGLQLFSSCKNNITYESFVTFENCQWEKERLAKFEVSVEDTLTFYNFYLTLRHSSDYPYSNIYVFRDLIYPNGEARRDTINLLLADRRGKWVGSGYGDIKTAVFQARQRFENSGIHSFIFEQGMRNDTLFGIQDLGIRIEKEQ